MLKMSDTGWDNTENIIIEAFELLQDLTAIGIKKPNHRKKLKAEIAQLNVADGLPEYIPVSTVLLFIIFRRRNQDGIVGTAPRLRCGWFGVRILARQKIFLFPKLDMELFSSISHSTRLL